MAIFLQLIVILFFCWLLSCVNVNAGTKSDCYIIKFSKVLKCLKIFWLDANKHIFVSDCITGYTQEMNNILPRCRKFCGCNDEVNFGNKKCLKCCKIIHGTGTPWTIQQNCKWMEPEHGPNNGMIFILIFENQQNLLNFDRQYSPISL